MRAVLLSVQPHRGISCFFAHILRALALLPSWALPENRERWWRMPGALPLSPSQIRQRVCVWGGGSGREMTKRRRGRERRRRSTGIMCQSHLSLSIPYSQHCTKSTAQWDWACLIQIWKIKQLSCVTSGSLTRSFLRDLGQVWEREAHIRNPNELSWLHYDPEMLKQDALDGFLPVMGQQRHRYMCLMINRPMDLEGL